MDWINQVISDWASDGVILQRGITVSEIFNTEELLGFKFPQDFIDLYLKINGFEEFGWNKNMFSLWSLDKIEQEYNESGDTNYIGFCDFLLNSHSIGFLKAEAGCFKNYNQILPIANTFKEAITLINSNSDLIY